MLDVRLDGEVIATIEEQALAVRIQTSRGETSATGLGPDDGVIDLIIDRVPPGGPQRLDQAEARAMQEIRDRSPEGTIVGFTRDFQVHPSGLSATQGTHDETLREGGVDTELTRKTRANGQVPSVDLAQGLGQDDVDTRSARLTAFGEHGDAQKAIDDNPGKSGEGDTSGTARDSVTSADDTSYNPASLTGEDSPPTSGDDAGQSGPGDGSSSEDDDTKDLGKSGSQPTTDGGTTSAPDEGKTATGPSGGTTGGIKLPGKASGTAKKS